MKSISILVFLVLCGMAAMAQTTSDENGRPVGAKPSFSVSSLDDIYLSKASSSTSSEIKIDYSLPNGEKSGKISLFNPKRDEEIKTYTLSTETGSIFINLKDMTVTEFGVGLYDSSGKHLKALNIYN